MGPVLWRIRHKGRKASALAVLAALILCSSNLSAHDRLNQLEVSQPGFSFASIPTQMEALDMIDLVQHDGVANTSAARESIRNANHDAGICARPTRFLSNDPESICRHFQSRSVIFPTLPRKEDTAEIEQTDPCYIGIFVATVFCFDDIRTKLGPHFDMRSRGPSNVDHVETYANVDSILLEYERPNNFGRYRDPSPIGLGDGLFGDVSGAFGGFGRVLSDGNRSLHIAGLSGGGFGQEAKLLLSGGPKLVGGQPQTNGGDRQNYSEPTDNAFVVSLKEGVGLFEDKRRSNVEGGAVFFIIVIGGLLTVLWLYQAQR